MATGRVKFYDAFKGFGFIVPDDGSQDVYVHSKEVKEAGLDFLAQGQRVSYDLKELRNRVISHNIRLLTP
jgi:CspA family cold shock protein